MDPFRLREFEAQLDDWLRQGYQIMADEADGEIRITVIYVSRAGEPGKEREQLFWPRVPETVDLLVRHGVVIARPGAL